MYHQIHFIIFTNDSKKNPFRGYNNNFYSQIILRCFIILYYLDDYEHQILDNLDIQNASFKQMKYA